jgi:hypothetical protein
LDFGNVPTVWYFLFFPKAIRKTKNTTLSKHFQNPIEKQKIPHCRNISKIQKKNKKYHTVGTFPKSNRKTKNTTLSEHFQNPIEKLKIPHCRNISKIQ